MKKESPSYKYSVKLQINESNTAIKINYNEIVTLISQSTKIITKAKTFLTLCKDDKVILPKDVIMFIAINDFNALRILEPEIIEDKKQVLVFFSGFDKDIPRLDWLKQKGAFMEDINKTLLNKSYNEVKTCLQRLLIETQRNINNPIAQSTRGIITQKSQLDSRGIVSLRQLPDRLPNRQMPVITGQDSQEIIDNQKLIDKFGEVGLLASVNETQIEKLWKIYQNKQFCIKTWGKYTTPEMKEIYPKALTEDRSIYSILSPIYGDSKIGTSFYNNLRPPCLAPISFWKIPTNVKFPITVYSKGLEICEDGNLKMSHPDKIAAWKGVIASVIKQIGIAVLSGKGQDYVQCPIKLYEPLSMISRIKEVLSSYPYWIHKANETTDHLERMKLILCGVAASLTMPLGHLKPFSPILGETSEQIFEDGTKLYQEQTQVDPYITNFYMIKPKIFRAWGRYEHGGAFRLNSIDIIYKGPQTIEFLSDKTRCTIYFPIFVCTNMNYGVRHGYFKSKAAVVYPEFKIKGFLDLEKLSKPVEGKFAKRKDAFVGKIYIYNPETAVQVNTGFTNLKHVFDDRNDLVEKLCSLEGNYLGCLEFEGKEYWNINKHTPYKCYAVNHPCPSDARYREDLNWLYHMDTEQSFLWLTELSRVEKNDKKVREEYIKSNEMNYN